MVFYFINILLSASTVLKKYSFKIQSTTSAHTLQLSTVIFHMKYITGRVLSSIACAAGGFKTGNKLLCGSTSCLDLATLIYDGTCCHFQIFAYALSSHGALLFKPNCVHPPLRPLNHHTQRSEDYTYPCGHCTSERGLACSVSAKPVQIFSCCVMLRRMVE